MSEPTSRFRLIPNDTAVAALDTPAERLGTITDEETVSTAEGYEADFGTIDISEGAALSDVLTMLWDITADGGNSQVDNFKLWCNAIGFDQAASVVRFAALSGGDQASPSNTQNYVADATSTTYTLSDMPEAEPGSQNVYPSDEGSSMDLDTNSDDVVMWAMILSIAAAETPGTYKGLTSGKELQFSFKCAYS